MINFLKSLYFFLFFLVLNNGVAQESPPVATELCQAENTVFAPGEKLVYTIYYNWKFIWLAAGYVVFTVQENDNHYLIKAVGKTYPSYNWIFKVDDYFYSFVDKNTLLPVRAKRDINEDGYIIHNDISFDQENKIAVSKLKINDKEERIIKKSFDACMYDILSIMYRLRNIDKSTLKKGDTIPFSLMMDDEIYDLTLEYQGDFGAKKVRKLGKFDTYKISPSVIKGRVFADNERMHIWVSNDKNNIPLIIESPLAVGKIQVILKKYEGVKYPLKTAGKH